MNFKENFIHNSDCEDEQIKMKEDKMELKVPFDMKIFWKNIDDKYFKNLDKFSKNEVNHLVNLNSKYGIYFK